MVGGHGEDEVLAEQQLAVELVVVDGQGHQRHVEPPLRSRRCTTSVFSSTSRSSRWGNRRCRLGHDVGEQVRRQGGEQAHAERARLGVDGLTGDARMSSASARMTWARSTTPARLGQQDVAGVALDELDAELALQLLELHRQRGLGHERRLGRPAEVAVLGHGHEVLELTQVHGWCLRTPPRGD